MKSSLPAHVSTHRGGFILFIGAAQFVLVMLVVQLFYPGYSDSMNPISDLGNSNLSPLSLLYNASIITIGIAGLIATFLMADAFPKRLSRLLGLGFFSLGNIGLILVGIFPENTTVFGGWAHSLAGQVAFPSFAAALLAMALAMRLDLRWKNYKLFTFTMGLLSLVAVSLYGSQIYLGLGPGGMERVFLGADLVWLILIGRRLTRLSTAEGTEPRPEVS